MKAPAGVQPPSRPLPPSPLWDVSTRLFHWLMAGGVALCLLTAWVLPPSAVVWHYAGGAATGAVLVARLVWGIYGSPASRFSSFPLSVAELRHHALQLWKRDPGHWPGHPPLGALMAVTLWAIIALLLLTGVTALAGEEQLGPLAAWVGFQHGSPAALLHRALGLLTAGLVALHLAGVIVESVIMRIFLPWTMVSGHRPLAAGQQPEALVSPDTSPVASSRPLPALALSLGLLAILAPLLFLASRQPSLASLSALEASDGTARLYRQECGDCHMPYHPSLLPAASWQGLTSTLSSHFGEDASLSEDRRRRLAGWLTDHAAESWDSKAANAFRRVSEEAPWQITATPFWTNRHHFLPASLFTSPAVKSKSNCQACHQDAADGLFRRMSIVVPAIVPTPPPGGSPPVTAR